MSRSYKKTPIIKDHDSGKFGKKQANHKVRRYKISEDGLSKKSKDYKKVYNTWEIHDQISYWSKEDAIKSYYKNEFWQKEYSLEDFLEKVWAKEMKRK